MRKEKDRRSDVRRVSLDFGFDEPLKSVIPLHMSRDLKCSSLVCNSAERHSSSKLSQKRKMAGTELKLFIKTRRFRTTPLLPLKTIKSLERARFHLQLNHCPRSTPQMFLIASVQQQLSSPLNRQQRRNAIPSPLPLPLLLRPLHSSAHRRSSRYPIRSQS